MNWNNIFKGIISIFILIPLVVAQNDETLKLSIDDAISVLNDNKELKSLSIYGHTLTQEDINTICILNNLEILTLGSTITFEEDVNFECLKDLKIKQLFIEFEKHPKELLKYFPNLETLFMQPVRTLYQEDLENIIAMKNLQQLELYIIYECEVDFEALKDTSNIRILKFYGFNSFPLTPNFFKIFSQVEELYIVNHVFSSQQEADGLKSLKNLKDFSISAIQFHPCSDGKGNLIPLDYGSFIYQNIKEKAINNIIHELFLEKCMLKPTITQEDVNKFCNLDSLETFDLNSSIEEDVNFECFKNLEIKKLNVTTDERPKEILKYFPNLETLTINPVKTFYQEELENIVGMKNLKNLTLSTIKESSVDFETVTNTSNVRRLEIDNFNGKDLPLTPNFFKIFSKIEEFDIIGHYINQEEVDGLKSLENLKELMFGLVLCNDGELDLGHLKDILKYGFYSMGYVDYARHFNANCIRKEGIKEGREYVYIYNRYRNKCIHYNEKSGDITFGDCNDKLESILWIGEGGGSIVYAANPNCCFAGNHLSCGDYCVYGTPAPSRDLEFWISNSHINRAPSGSSHRSDFGPINVCLGSKDSDSDELIWRECDDYDPDQFWEFNTWNWNATEFVPPPPKEEKPSTEEYIYIYNADRNECLTTSGIVDTPITYGKCDNSDNTIWITSDTNGHFRSKANPNYCIRPNNNISTDSEVTVILGKCSPIAHNNQFYREKNFMKKRFNSSYYNYCIGSLDSDPHQADLKTCDEKDPDQIWYFNHWDPSVVIKDNAIVYFYNAYKNVCMHTDTDGTTVTTGSCDFSDDSALWEIPNSHKGNYRSKAHPEKCLSIVDGEVGLRECNEETKLTLDGNFIRSLKNKEHCIASAKSSNTLEYIEGCSVEDPDHIWYANIWTEEKEE